MKQTLSAKEILEEIEFELLQGAIVDDDLGKGIQDVRKHHAALRALLFEESQEKADAAQLIRKQFQINDMLLTILGEVAIGLRSNQLDLYRMGQWQQRKSAHPDKTSNSQNSTIEPDTPANAPKYVDDGQFGTGTTSSLPDEYFASTDPLLSVAHIGNEEIEQAMDGDALDIEMIVRPTPVPIIGWFVRRMRSALHSLTLFYVRQLARRQSKVNRSYGEALLSLVHTVSHCEQKIDELQQEVSHLRRQLQQNT